MPCSSQLPDFHSQSEAGDSAVNGSADLVSRLISAFDLQLISSAFIDFYRNSLFLVTEPNQKTCLIHLGFPSIIGLTK